MKKSGKLVTGLLGLAMAAVTVLPAMAAINVEHYVVHLAENKYWTYGGWASHTMGNQGALVRCESVYPDEENVPDNYRTIHCRIADYRGYVISEDPEVELQEGMINYQRMRIREIDANSLGTIYFQFRGNSNASAYALVSYKGDWDQQ